jgi:hypothetical protein
MISSRFAVIGFSYTDDAPHFSAHRKHANPDPTFDRPVANEAVFRVIRTNIQEVGEAADLFSAAASFATSAGLRSSDSLFPEGNV